MGSEFEEVRHAVDLKTREKSPRKGKVERLGIGEKGKKKYDRRPRLYDVLEECSKNLEKKDRMGRLEKEIKRLV